MLSSAPPTPVAQWVFHPSRLRDGELVAAHGPNLKVSGFPTLKSGGLALEGPWDAFTYPWYHWDRWPELPKTHVTLDLLVQLDPQKEPMGLAGCTFTTESDGPRGWALLWEKGEVVFEVATAQGKAQVRAKNVPLHKYVALTATYDQARVQLYLDGTLVGAVEAALGPITLNKRTPFAVGGWWQGDKTLGFQGIVRAYAVYASALTQEQVHQLSAVRLPKLPDITPLHDGMAYAQPTFVIEPTLQQVSTISAWVVWECSHTVRAEVHVKVDGKLHRVHGSGRSQVHKVMLTRLQPETTYTVQVHHEVFNGTLISKPITFTTLPRRDRPVRLAVVGDTQDHPEINHKVALGMRSHNPALGLIVGDLVGAGWEKEQWVHDFFGSMRPLWADVPLFPVLGNHDRNAHLYYALLALPETLYYYDFRAGAADIFTLDTEHPVEPGSVQYRWLEQVLARSTARWKIVAHHYPPYSSDLDDYGTDLGDTSARELCPLYDRYNVDLVFSGHIHSYERTHPLRAGKVVKDGTVYLVVGGGGGDLEEFLPTPPPFSAVRKSAHHYGILDITPQSLTFRAYNLDGTLFDTWEKRA